MTPTLFLLRCCDDRTGAIILPFGQHRPGDACQFVGDSDNHFVAGRPQFELTRPLSESPGIVLNPQQHRAGAVNEQAA